MREMKLQEIAELLRDVDFVMLHTRTEGGKIAGRPMSNNRDVEYDGASYYFLMEDTRRSVTSGMTQR